MSEVKIWLRPGMKVHHVSNKDIVMTVERLCYRYAVITCDSNEEGAYYNSAHHCFTKSKQILTGVICRWMNSEGKMVNAEFHSRELIPIVEDTTIKKNGNDYKKGVKKIIVK